MKGNVDTLCLSSHALELHKVENLIEALADRFYLNDSYFANMMVALTEAFNNAMIHGNKNNAAKKVYISFSQTEKEMIFTVSDEGDGFDHNEFLGNTLAQESKRGLLLIQTVSDKVEFSDNGRSVSIHFNVASVQNDINRNRMSAFGSANNVKLQQEDESKKH